MAINGVLGGLVAITGAADIILPHHALMAGAIGGGVVVFGVLLLERLKIDDPIGAIPVHAFGGLAARSSPRSSPAPTGSGRRSGPRPMRSRRLSSLSLSTAC